MKKSRKAARKAIKPVGRDPVVAIRVPPPVHKRIKAIAEEREQSMSETMGKLIEQALDWAEAFGDHQTFFRSQREEVRRLLAGNVKAGLLEKGWKIVGHVNKDGAYVELFAPPEAGFSRSGFGDATDDQSDKETGQ